MQMGFQVIFFLKTILGENRDISRHDPVLSRISTTGLQENRSHYHYFLDKRYQEV